MLALCTLSFCCLCKVCWNVSEAFMLAICVWLCSCRCIVCSNVSDVLMLAICVRFCSYLCKACSCTCFRSSLTCFADFFSFLINSSSDSKAFQRFIAFSGSPTAVQRAFLLFDVKGWPQSQTELMCTTVLHCGHTFLRRIDLSHSIACSTVLHSGHTFLNLS